MSPAQASRSRLRTWLVGMLIVGIANNSQGTFATFTASTTNLGTIATSTLVLSNEVGAGTTCLSTGGGTTDLNANAGCDELFELLVQDPGGQDNVKVTVANAGSMDAASLKLSWAGGTTPCATVDAPDALFHGTGDLCGDLRLYVQEYATGDSGPNQRVGGTCWYGNLTDPTDCSFAGNRDLAHFDQYTGDPDALDLGPLPAGGTRWFRVYLSLRNGVGNAAQGRLVTFGLTWTLEQ